MENLQDARIREGPRQRFQALECKRVDDRDHTFDADLHQTGLRIVGFLAKEFGIDRHIGARLTSFDESLERGFGVYELLRCHRLYKPVLDQDIELL